MLVADLDVLVESKAINERDRINGKLLLAAINDWPVHVDDENDHSLGNFLSQLQNELEIDTITHQVVSKAKPTTEHWAWKREAYTQLIELINNFKGKTLNEIISHFEGL